MLRLCTSCRISAGGLIRLSNGSWVAGFAGKFGGWANLEKESNSVVEMHSVVAVSFINSDREDSYQPIASNP